MPRTPSATVARSSSHLHGCTGTPSITIVTYPRTPFTVPSSFSSYISSEHWRRILKTPWLDYLMLQILRFLRIGFMESGFSIKTSRRV